MQLRLLGTGCPSVDYKRFGPANLVLTNKASISAVDTFASFNRCVTPEPQSTKMEDLFAETKFAGPNLL